MKKIVYILIAVVLFLNACKPKQEPVNLIQALNTGANEAVGAYFTEDAEGHQVLCWTEKDNRDSLYRLKYAVYNPQKDTFDAAVTVPGSEGMSISPESMGKIAFKADGTVLAIFGKRFEKEKNPFAGAVYYSLSANQGKTWSRPAFLSSDTSHAYGRSFFDVTTTKDGELAAVWLDGRYGKAIKGSALFFVRTQPGKGFGADTCLDKGTCECCRTNILTDENGNIHIAYRSIMFPSALSGKQVRDMVYILSRDNGKTFSAPATISKDNWEVEGCPHSGPSLAVNKNTVNGVWFTAGGSPGLYFTSADFGTHFKKRTLITATGRHPQMMALPDGKMAMVCEETLEAQPAMPMKMDHSQGTMNMAHMPASPAKIVLRTLKDGNIEKTFSISDGHNSDHHAVITPVKEDLLIAWIREDQGHSKLYYSRVKTPI